MCGINGVIANDSISFIDAMNNAIAHRGPDSNGSYSDSFVSLGHQRLAIQDLSELGHQPMFDSTNNYIIIFNGEIYNHLEIREKLKSKYTFKSESDTETILYSFIEFGVKAFNMLNGIFALAIYNKLSNELIICRDQFGVKPLYYSLGDDFLLFSSEIKALTEHPKFDKTLDTDSLANYIYFLWSPGEATPFLNCKKLLPGQYIKINVTDIKTFSITPYYEIPFNGKYLSLNENQWIDKLENALLNAVERQLLSDVPIGFFLSGGLDSSLILALAKKIRPHQNFECFTIRNETMDGFTDDLPFARKVAKYLDVQLHEIDSNIDIVDDFDNMIWHLDEPQADPAPLHVRNISREARAKGIYVLLGGVAGDDLFSGYRRHQIQAFRRKISFIPIIILQIANTILRNFSTRYSFIRRAQKVLSIFEYKDVISQNASLYAWLRVNDVKKLFNKSQLKNFKPIHFLTESLKKIPNEKSTLNQLLYWDMKYFLVDHNLNYTDKMSMSCGVEARVPFLDKELVELSVQIPPDLKMKGKETKYLLKKVAERYLPKEVIYRQKSGFGAPVRDWIVNKLGQKIALFVKDMSAIEKQIFNVVEIKVLIHKNKYFKKDASYSIWSLLAINSWIKQFKNETKPN